MKNQRNKKHRQKRQQCFRETRIYCQLIIIVCRRLLVVYLVTYYGATQQNIDEKTHTRWLERWASRSKTTHDRSRNYLKFRGQCEIRLGLTTQMARRSQWAVIRSSSSSSSSSSSVNVRISHYTSSLYTQSHTSSIVNLRSDKVSPEWTLAHCPLLNNTT